VRFSTKKSGRPTPLKRKTSPLCVSTYYNEKMRCSKKGKRKKREKILLENAQWRLRPKRDAKAAADKKTPARRKKERNGGPRLIGPQSLAVAALRRGGKRGAPNVLSNLTKPKSQPQNKKKKQASALSLHAGESQEKKETEPDLPLPGLKPVSAEEEGGKKRGRSSLDARRTRKRWAVRLLPVC